MICFHSLNYWYLQQLGIVKRLLGRVVMCFHSLNYWYLPQRQSIHEGGASCCDLLSFFELLIFTTTRARYHTYQPKLWFAFILWTTDIYNNKKASAATPTTVVICFHSLNYWYLQQQERNYPLSFKCCDLLSFFELLIFTTTMNSAQPAFAELWFAFILWTTDIYNNLSPPM